MKKCLLLILLITLLLTACHKKDNPYQINKPESVVLNPVTGDYLISNAGSGIILSLHQKQKFSVFTKTKMTSPKGMAVSGDRLYVSDVTRLMGFNLKDGKNVFEFALPQAKGLNDVSVSPQGMVYVSDMEGSKIYIVNPKNKKYDIFANPVLKTPNGVLYDDSNGNPNLYIVSYRDTADIQVLDLKSKTLSLIPHTEVSKADGITRDNAGNWLVSSWADSTIYKFTPDFSAKAAMEDKFTSPADIWYNKAASELAIPQLLKNVINFTQPIQMPAKGSATPATKPAPFGTATIPHKGK